MKHVLDNPVWSALISGNKHLANGPEAAKYFATNVAPFAGTPENTPASLDLLRQAIPFDNPIVFVTNEKIAIPDSWKTLQRIDGFQMVYTKPTESLNKTLLITPLTEQNIPQMLALTQLTNPGPFSAKTIEFGHYKGIFDGEQLVAMAGQRLHAFESAEISAVCTHPDYLGRGYARQLILYHIHRIYEASGTPYLHVRSDNIRAINVYRSMGFDTRTEIYFYVLQKS